jgi:hypothetical protein
LPHVSALIEPSSGNIQCVKKGLDEYSSRPVLTHCIWPEDGSIRAEKCRHFNVFFSI